MPLDALKFEFRTRSAIYASFKDQVPMGLPHGLLMSILVLYAFEGHIYLFLPTYPAGYDQAGLGS